MFLLSGSSNLRVMSVRYHSSANVPMWFVGVIGISAVCNGYTRGPKTLPCGTPEFMSLVEYASPCKNNNNHLY